VTVNNFEIILIHFLQKFDSLEPKKIFLSGNNADLEIGAIILIAVVKTSAETIKVSFFDLLDSGGITQFAAGHTGVAKSGTEFAQTESIPDILRNWWISFIEWS
jgi:hypothetical protein